MLIKQRLDVKQAELVVIIIVGSMGPFSNEPKARTFHTPVNNNRHQNTRYE